MMIRALFVTIGMSLLAVSSQANIIEVPNDVLTIQSAIDSAIDGDTVLVAPGRYYENIIFRGKKVVLTSIFLQSGDPQDILETIIDGSQHTHLDSASTIAMYHAEDSTTAVIGFLITGGSGCIVFGAREGGGVNLNNASPLIKNNIIVGNSAILPGWPGRLRGGGGINFRFSTAQMIGNYVLSNKGNNYCGGVLIQEASVVARNNVIAYNDGGNLLGTWDGAGGVYTYKCAPASEFTNNIIAFNHAARAGGFYANVNGNSILTNNILYGNDNGQIVLNNTNPINYPVSYSDVEGGYSGTANVDLIPMWNLDMTLDPISALVDLGDPNALYDDIEDGSSPGNGLYPSLGTIRNDMGAFGGSDAIFVIPLPTISDPILSFGGAMSTFVDDSAYVAHEIRVPIANGGLAIATFDSLISTNSAATVGVFTPAGMGLLFEDTLEFLWTPSERLDFIDTVMIYHNDTASGSPALYIIDYTIAACCIVPGDYSHDGSFNISDVTAAIGRIFSSGLPPLCQDEGDANGDNSFNISDVTYGIARIFNARPAPICGTTGI